MFLAISVVCSTFLPGQSVATTLLLTLFCFLLIFFSKFSDSFISKTSPPRDEAFRQIVALFLSITIVPHSVSAKIQISAAVNTHVEPLSKGNSELPMTNPFPSSLVPNIKH